MTLQITWFFLWGLLWAVFFMTDGFDFGIGTLLPFLAKNDTEKRMMIATMGPVWDGNEVWLIAAGGVTFAAFPILYAAMFSSFYAALMFILFALILRGVAMEFRNKVADPFWRSLWDVAIFIGSVTPAILFGVAFANIFRGIPLDANGVFQGDLFTLINTYGMLGGLFFLMLFLEHGALWLALKASGPLADRALCVAKLLWWGVLVFAVLFLVATWYETKLYANYLANPVLFLLPVVVVAALVQVRIFLAKNALLAAWISMAITIVGCTFFGLAGLFPNMLPSNLTPAASLTAFNASSSPLTLKIMLVVALIFVPIVIGYQVWAYLLFKDRVRVEDLEAGEGY